MADRAKQGTTERVESLALCSLVSQAVGEDPVGSAHAFDHYVLLELPTPWLGLWYEAKSAPRELLATFRFGEDTGRSVRPLALAPDPAHMREGYRRVLFYTAPAAPFSRYERREYLLPEREVAALVDAYLNRPEALPAFARYRLEGGPVRDLLVCTHGNVDICCGRFGYPVYKALREGYADETLRVWRASHFGGHNYAPTLIDLPEGRWWGHLTEADLEPLVTRARLARDLAGRYRGLGALPKLVQVLEREVLAREGWRWTENRVAGRVLDARGHGGEEDLEDPKFSDQPPTWARVRLDFVRPDGASGAYEATLVLAGHVTTLWASGDEEGCRSNHYDVRDLRQVEP